MAIIATNTITNPNISFSFFFIKQTSAIVVNYHAIKG